MAPEDTTQLNNDHIKTMDVDFDLEGEARRVPFSLKNYLGWMSYDIANTFYATGILSLIIFTWVLVKGQQSGLSYAESNALINFTLSAASIFMAVMLPILGSVSDVLNERKRFVLIFSAITIFMTYLFSISGNIYLVLILFAISMIAYQWAQVFYDAMLPGVVPPGQEARLSSLAIAIGYVGGAVVIFYASFLAHDQPNARSEKGELTLGYFPELISVILIGFILFSIPMLFVKETDWQGISKETVGDTIGIKENASYWQIAKSSFSELGDTFKDIFNNNSGMFFYIIAYFIIADFANLIVLINSTYLRDALGMAEPDIINATIVTGVSIVLFSYGIGQIADRYGAKRSFQVVGVLWVLSISLLLMSKLILPIGFVYLAALLVGPAFSGVWISQRQMVLELVPTEQEVGRYFGLTKFSGKISSAIGPPLWATLFFIATRYYHLSISGSYRFALIGMAVLLIVGFIILQFGVPNNHREFKERKKRLIEAMENM